MSLPALVLAVPRVGLARRVAAGILVLLVLVAMAALVRPVERAESVPLSRRLDLTSVGLTLPLSWLATGIGAAQPDDRLDLLGVRRGDATSVYPLASGARVLTVEDRAVVLALAPDDAAQVALARSADLLIVPLLRPRR